MGKACSVDSLTIPDHDGVLEAIANVEYQVTLIREHDCDLDSSVEEKAIADCVKSSQKMNRKVKELARQLQLIADELNADLESGFNLRLLHFRYRASSDSAQEFSPTNSRSCVANCVRSPTEGFLSSSSPLNNQRLVLGSVSSIALFALIYFSFLTNKRWRSSIA